MEVSDHSRHFLLLFSQCKIEVSLFCILDRYLKGWIHYTEVLLVCGILSFISGLFFKFSKYKEGSLRTTDDTSKALVESKEEIDLS
jgi:hypothetical protein